MIKAPLSESVVRHLDEMPADGMDIFLLESGTVRATVLNATRLVNEMRHNHKLDILETLALGYGYMGAGLCTNQMKGRDRLSINLECGPPMHGFSVSCNALGQVKGYLKVDRIEVEKIPERFDLAPVMGDGTLSVTKFPEGAEAPFTGTVSLVHKSVAKDLTRYFLDSEQIRTAISLSLFFDKSGIVKGAAGLFLQALPGADEQILEDLEDWLHEIPSIGKSLSEKVPTSILVQDTFGAFGPELVGSRGIEFWCDCEQARFVSYLASLPQSETETLKDVHPEYVEVKCHNCGTQYRISHDEVADFRSRNRSG